MNPAMRLRLIQLTRSPDLPAECAICSGDGSADFDGQSGILVSPPWTFSFTNSSPFDGDVYIPVGNGK